jgi:hypothetical protein
MPKKSIGIVGNSLSTDETSRIRRFEEFYMIFALKYA